MAINKAHAILFLTGTIGVSDGEWTLEEITEASKNGGLDKYFTDGADWQDKVEKGELTTETAIEHLKSLEKKDRLDCMYACLATAIADGILHENEKKLIIKLLAIFGDISFEELLSSHINFMKNIDNNKEKIYILNKITGEKIESPFEFIIAENDLDGYLNYAEAERNIELMGEGWRLPNFEEINEMSKYKQIIGMKKATYWTNEQDGNLVYAKSFVWYNISRFIIKQSTCGVRLVKDNF
jgi:uncharacterized tellurite resistance protein B-like protein